MTASIPQLELRPRNWTRKRFNRELKVFNTSQAQQVRITGYSQSLVSMVISAKATSLPCATALAAAVGRKPWEIWPRLYAPPAGGSPSEAPTTEPTPETTPEPGPTALAS